MAMLPEDQISSTQTVSLLRKPRSWFWYVVLLVIFFGVLGWFLRAPFLQPLQTQEDLTVTDIYLQSASDSFRDLDLEKTVQTYEQMLQDDEVEDKTRVKFLLGGVYNRFGDYQKGTPILKEVVDAPDVPSRLRMEALLGMIGPYYRGRRAEPLQLIFSYDSWPFNSVWDAQEMDIENLQDLEFALKDLLLITNEVSPLSYLQYANALWYSGKLMDEVVFGQDVLLPEQELEYKNVVLERLGEGDLLRDIEENSPTFRAFDVAYETWFGANHFRFVNISFLARVDPEYIEQTHREYDRLAGYYDRFASSASLQTLESFTQFYYAAFVVDLYDDESSRDEVAKTIIPTLESSGDRGRANKLGIWAFFERELTRPIHERGHNERSIYRIANVVPQFKQFLIEHNWYDEERAGIFVSR